MPDLPRPLRLRAVLAATGALVILLPPAAASAASGAAVLRAMRQQVPAAVVDAALGPEQREVPPARAMAEGIPWPVPVATIEGVPLRDLSTGTLAIGFHEGATRSLALTPVQDVPKGTPKPVVMPSRGRGTGPTTAMDVAVPVGVAITAPVSGEVVEANSYALYGSTQDFLVTIAPEDAPHLRVRMFHIEGPRVAIGDHVVAGETVIADSSRVLPFRSQIDRISGARSPHVHLQVDRA